MTTFMFVFDEMPLHGDGDVSCAEISGCAEIHVDRGIGWSVQTIAVNGWRPFEYDEATLAEAAAKGRALPRHRRIAVELTPDEPLAHLIRVRLATAWRPRVEEAVADHLAAHRANAAAAAANWRHRIARDS